MILNKKSKDELRTKIIEKLKEVPKGKRITIDKEILDELLFDTIITNKKTREIIKIPVWSGDFLQKIDLSEVDFTNVSWSILGLDDIGEVLDSEDIDINELKEKINEGREKRQELTNGFDVGYNGTNAHIDLTKSYEALQDQVKYISIVNCNFQGIDLSNNNLEDIEDIYILCSDVSKTRLAIPKKTHVFASDSSLENIDLSDRKTSIIKYFRVGFDYSACNLKNTGIQIIFDINKEGIEKDLIIDEEKIKQAMENDWVGCYVNGKRILSKEEKQANAKQILKEYQAMENGIVNTIIGNIDKQIVKMKKKTEKEA